MKYKLFLFLIFILALLLRTISLNKIPYGFHADEARSAWGAWTIYTTGQDDWGNKFPMYYDTFGDQRPTGIFYATIPFLIMFGKNVTASRLPAAFLGTLSVLAIFSLTNLITKNKKAALFSALLLAVSPWHIVFSRSGSEGIISGFLTLFGLFLWISGLKKNNNKRLFYSVIFGISSYFFYHTARILVPIYWIVSWLFVNKKQKIAALLSIVLVSSTLLFLIKGESKGRFLQVSIFNTSQMQQDLLKASIEEGPNKVFINRFFHNKAVWYFKQYAKNYLEYFSGNFLLNDASLPLRYTVPSTGLITYADLFLLLIGIAYLIRLKKYYLIGIFLSLSPLVSALTITDIPNSHRSLNMLFFISMLEGLGAYIFSKIIIKQKLILAAFIVVFILFWLFFWHNYIVHTPKSIIPYHQDGGTIELAQKLIEIREQYPQIYLTNTPSDLTPWIGFAGNWNVKSFIEQSKYRKEKDWSFDRFSFIRKRCPTTMLDSPEENSLMVDTEGCPEPKSNEKIFYQPVFTIERPDNSDAYKGWKVIYR